MTSIARTLAVTLVLLTCAPAARAQVPDHLKCYRVKDALNLKGTVDLDTPQFGIDPGCKVSKATLFCVAATKTSVVVIDKKTKQPITPLPVSGPDLNAPPRDRICYKVKCPKPTTPIADQTVTDQFASRTTSKFQASLVCTPAFKGTARFVDNGNSITDNFTGLQWEEKNGLDGVANLGNPQDVDNTYSWSSSGTAADGTAFTNFLSQLNACTSADGSTTVFAGFAAHCDWRLPTPAELKTILDCSFVNPCISPVFGPTAATSHWTSTSFAGGAANAWFVDFGNGSAFITDKTTLNRVRAVRGGS